MRFYILEMPLEDRQETPEKWPISMLALCFQLPCPKNGIEARMGWEILHFVVVVNPSWSVAANVILGRQEPSWRRVARALHDYLAHANALQSQPTSTAPPLHIRTRVSAFAISVLCALFVSSLSPQVQSLVSASGCSLCASSSCCALDDRDNTAYDQPQTAITTAFNIAVADAEGALPAADAIFVLRTSLVRGVRLSSLGAPPPLVHLPRRPQPCAQLHRNHLHV